MSSSRLLTTTDVHFLFALLLKLKVIWGDYECGYCDGGVNYYMRSDGQGDVIYDQEPCAQCYGTGLIRDR